MRIDFSSDNVLNLADPPSKRAMVLEALLLAWALICCGAGSSNGGLEWTERQLQHSQLWQDRQVPLILSKPGSLPDGLSKALVKAIDDSNVTHIKVICPEPSDAQDVCQSLTDHLLAVRLGETIEGLSKSYETKSESEFLSAVLELLLSSSITKLWSYSDLTNYSSLHQQFLLAVSPNSEEYATLLSSVLKWSIPLGVAMTPGVLPLSQRRQYMPPPSLLQLWYVVKGQAWYSNQDTTGFNLHVVQNCKSSLKLIREFVERVHYPIVVHYKDDATLRMQFADSGLHIVIIFPGRHKETNETEPMSLAVNLAQATFMNYAFLIMSDRSRLRKFVKDIKPTPYVIVLPYGFKSDLMSWAVEGRNLVGELRYIMYTLRAYAVENPRLQDGQEVYAEIGPSIHELSEIKKQVATRKHHIFAYFCPQGARQCIQVGYRVVREVISVLRVTELGKSLGAHVVVYKSANVKPFKLKNLITCAVYNRTTRAWTVAPEEISSGSKALQFISRLTDMSELWEIGRIMGHVTLTLADVPPPPQPLQEDDQLNQVVDSLPYPAVPEEIKLNSSTFRQHISNFSRTAVVFCVHWSVQCKVSLHYVAAAHKQLNRDLNISLAIVGCENHTELCISYQVTVYPTVLLFTPSTIKNPTPISGIMDSSHLLAELGQKSTIEEEHHNNESLIELTPNSLPVLLAGSAGLNSMLVLWCNGGVSSEAVATFTEQASHSNYPNFVYAWINSDKHSNLLSRVLSVSPPFPAVIALSLKQHSVYLLSVEDDFKDKLASFLEGLNQGTLQASGHLKHEVWSPLQPPVSFPSIKKAQYNSTDHPSNSDNKDSTRKNSQHHPHTEL